MATTPDHSYLVGKFLVSPLSRITESGDFLASLSIRSGQGRGTHDRVFRFLPRFATRQCALEYAARQGRDMLHPQAVA